MLSFGNKEFRNLQEQVLKNAQDIETLKGRENLQIVIVEELPEVGNPNYIYLVPNEDEEESNVYNEYIWLVEEETYEKIGGVSIDLTNYVTLNTDQTIDSIKSIAYQKELRFATSDTNKYFSILEQNNYFVLNAVGLATRLKLGSYLTKFVPTSTSQDLGATDARWQDLNLSRAIDFGNDAKITKDSSNRLNFNFGGNAIIKVGSNSSYVKASWLPEDNNTHDLGSSSYAWKDAYIAGNISDGTNTVSVANMSTKTTSAYRSGTFDSNGESTVTIADETPTGLFIFAYGNCQCMFQLTATMVQNADVTPIRVAIPMMYNSAAVNGWLEISRSVYAFTFTITDGTNHVDSGYAWTLTKTNLL